MALNHHIVLYNDYTVHLLGVYLLGTASGGFFATDGDVSDPSSARLILLLRASTEVARFVWQTLEDNPQYFPFRTRSWSVSQSVSYLDAHCGTLPPWQLSRRPLAVSKMPCCWCWSRCQNIPSSDWPNTTIQLEENERHELPNERIWEHPQLNHCLSTWCCAINNKKTQFTQGFIRAGVWILCEHFADYLDECLSIRLFKYSYESLLIRVTDINYGHLLLR